MVIGEESTSIKISSINALPLFIYSHLKLVNLTYITFSYYQNGSKIFSKSEKLLRLV